MALPAALSQVKAVGDKLGDLKSKLVEFAFGLNQVTDAIGLVRGAFGKFVDAFRPDVMVRFEQVAKDLLATIGENLVPIIQLATGFFRQFADVIAGMTPQILPIIKQVTAAMQPMIDQFFAFFTAIADVGILQTLVEIQLEIWGALSSIFEALAPALIAVVKVFMFFEQVLMTGVLAIVKVIAINFQVLAFLLRPLNAMIEALTQIFGDMNKTMFDLFGVVGEVFGELFDLLGNGLVSVMDQVVTSIKAVSEYFRYLINQIRELVGLDPLKDGGSSMGKASGGARFTSTDELYKKLAAQVFGGGKEEDVPKKSMGYLEKIHQFLQNDVKPFLDGYKETKQVVNDVASAPGQAYDKATSFLGDLARSMVIKSR